MFKMPKVQTTSRECVSIFRDIGPLPDRFKASRVVSLLMSGYTKHRKTPRDLGKRRNRPLRPQGNTAVDCKGPRGNTARDRNRAHKCDVIVGVALAAGHKQAVLGILHQRLYRLQRREREGEGREGMTCAQCSLRKIIKIVTIRCQILRLNANLDTF